MTKATPMTTPRTLPRLLLSASLLGVALTAAGCPVVHRGQTQIKWASGQTDPLVLQALKDGEYALYAIGDAKPRAVLILEAGDPLGFEKAADGKVTAIAADHRLSFPEDTYYWNYRGKVKE